MYRQVWWAVVWPVPPRPWWPTPPCHRLRPASPEASSASPPKPARRAGNRSELWHDISFVIRKVSFFNTVYWLKIWNLDNWKCNFHMTHPACSSVGWLDAVSRSVGLSRHDFLKGQKVTLPCSYRSTCLMIICNMLYIAFSSNRIDVV